MLSEEVKRYRELSGDTNPNTPISRIGGYLDGYERALEQEPTDTWSIKDIADTFKKRGLIKEQEPCDDCISRQAAIDAFWKLNVELRPNAIDAILNMINDLQPVTSAEAKEDVPDTNNDNIYVCPCGYGWDKSKVVRHHFCPNCGAKVAEGGKE